MTSTEVLGIRVEDMDYMMQKHKITLKEGRLPLEGHKEVALDSRVAKNRAAKLGDKIGNSINKNDHLDGEYTVVGLIEGKGFKIKPCVHKDFKEYSIDYVYGNAVYHIKVIRSGNSTITLDGNVIEGDIIPVTSDGEHEVKINI